MLPQPRGSARDMYYLKRDSRSLLYIDALLPSRLVKWLLWQNYTGKGVCLLGVRRYPLCTCVQNKRILRMKFFRRMFE